jgi:RNA methyltransferase, TrmH family
MIHHITSLQNSKIKAWKALSKQTGDLAELFFIVEGHHLVQEAYKSGLLKEIICLDTVLEQAPDIETTIVPSYIIEAISQQKTPQGIIGVCVKKTEPIHDDGPIMYFDTINDPGNLGTMLRTSLAFGIKKCFISAQSVELYHPKVIASSQGAIFQLDAFMDHHYHMIEQLIQNGYTLFATGFGPSTISLNDVIFPRKSIVIFGNESHGVSKVFLEKAKQTVHIDMSHIDSLNVAIAHGIITYVLSKQLKL